MMRGATRVARDMTDAAIADMLAQQAAWLAHKESQVRRPGDPLPLPPIPHIERWKASAAGRMVAKRAAKRRLAFIVRGPDRVPATNTPTLVRPVMAGMVDPPLSEDEKMARALSRRAMRRAKYGIRAKRPSRPVRAADPATFAPVADAPEDGQAHDGPWQRHRRGYLSRP